MDYLRRAAGGKAEGGDVGDHPENDEGLETESQAAWRSRIAYLEIGLRPDEAAGYCLNDLLPLLYRHRRQQEADARNQQILAWDISRCVGNLFGSHPKSFADLFPGGEGAKVEKSLREKAIAKARRLGHPVPDG